ncbi:hypothetical protein CEXT_343781 [Caerostris extrusa]|uniref:Uncharacterized protein n=1 Tax=Caerostris extrusa TaxID=172846 RepID=A0AAV4UTZ5_CAEEX|nr:hypothetical protein CEXT_343781 [Caerostris extrusa]
MPGISDHWLLILQRIIADPALSRIGPKELHELDRGKEKITSPKVLKQLSRRLSPVFDWLSLRTAGFSTDSPPDEWKETPCADLSGGVVGIKKDGENLPLQWGRKDMFAYLSHSTDD